MIKFILAGAAALQIFHEPKAFEQYRGETMPSDYVLLRSGEGCSRCDAIENTVKSLNRHVQIPVIIAKFGKSTDPILEYHQAIDEGLYREEPYNGHMTLGSILKFLETKLSKQNALKEATDIGSAVSESHANGRLPFVGLFQDDQCAGMAIYKEAHKLLKKERLLKNADFWFVIDPTVKSTMGQLSITHPNEMRLATSIPSVGFIVDWIRNESVPQFGALNKEIILRASESIPPGENKSASNWLVLIGDPKTYELFQHEFRLFAMYHRDEWHSGFLSREAPDFLQLLKRVLNVEDDIESVLQLECPNECVVGRRNNFIRFFTTDNLSDSRLSQIAKELLNPAVEEETVEQIESLVADLAVENDEFQKTRIQTIGKSVFEQKVVKAPEAVLVLMHAPHDEVSQELKNVFLSVAKSLQMKGIKFYEMVELPPPDDRYIPPALPHLWFKPPGENVAPLAIPWQDDEMPPASATTAAASYGQVVAKKIQSAVKMTLLKARSVLTFLLSNVDGELRKLEHREKDAEL